MLINGRNHSVSPQKPQPPTATKENVKEPRQRWWCPGEVGGKMPLHCSASLIIRVVTESLVLELCPAFVPLRSKLRRIQLRQLSEKCFCHHTRYLMPQNPDPSSTRLWPVVLGAAAVAHTLINRNASGRPLPLSVAGLCPCK